MVKENILVDTSLFIDYYRKQKKETTLLVELSEKYTFSVSIITKFELFVGIKNNEERMFWEEIFNDITIIPLADKEVEKAAKIVQYLRRTNNMIGLQDIFIASTAIANGLSLATINVKDFVRISDVKLIV
jgi:predicted nucleic acid-binding protein